MKALSVHQPWANLIVQGKRVLEIRSWTAEYRGRLIIHAGLIIEKKECERLGIAISKDEVGCLLGRVDLVEIEILTKEKWKKYRSLHLEAGPRPYGDNTFAWIFKNPQKFSQPIKHKGQLGLFSIS